MRTRYRNRLTAAREIREHLCPWPNRKTELSCPNNFGICLGNSRRRYHHIRPHLIDGGCNVADMDTYSGFFQLSHIARTLQIGARYGTAPLMKHKRNAAHAGAPNTDEMGTRNCKTVLIGHT